MHGSTSATQETPPVVRNTGRVKKTGSMYWKSVIFHKSVYALPMLRLVHSLSDTERPLCFPKKRNVRKRPRTDLLNREGMRLRSSTLVTESPGPQATSPVHHADKSQCELYVRCHYVVILARVSKGPAVRTSWSWNTICKEGLLQVRTIASKHVHVRANAFVCISPGSIEACISACVQKR
jgi:hypothetical protein